MTSPDLDPAPAPLHADIPAAVNNLVTSAPGRDLINRLRTRFGLGANPVKRLAFYRKLERLVQQHGDRANQAIAEAIAQSVGLERPDHYFCKTVAGKFRDLGWWNPVIPW